MTQLWIFELNATFNTLDGCNFLLPTIKVTTFVIANSNLTNFTLINGASFASYTITQTLSNLLEAGYQVDNIFHIEVRPVILYNCTFESVSLTSDSALVRSNNPMTILLDSTFKYIKVSESNVLEIGQYIPPPARKQPGYIYATSSTVENQIFTGTEGYGKIYNIYKDVREYVTGYKINKAETALYFTVIQNNAFDDIHPTQNLAVLSVSTVTIETSIAGLFGNSFTEITSDTDKDFSLINLNGSNETVLEANTFQNISGDGRAIGIFSSDSENIQPKLNTFEDITTMAGVTIRSSICGEVTISQDTVRSIKTENT